ncbi:MAG TPA: zinc ribbon domain-containing protein [Verrucomicrobiae bacterium]|nr:zinc ribbon domain-containing protein [Verrucomicrobiae bacterium]
MKTCSYCGKDNEASRQHCFECGTELSTVDEVKPAVGIVHARHCAFCNTQNPAGSEVCSICGNDLIAIHPESNSFQAEPETLELFGPVLEYESEHGFSHPDWEKFSQQVSARVPRTSWDVVYRQAAREWVGQLCEDLGGDYRGYESPHFLLMCAEGQKISDTLLQYSENAQAAIMACLGKLRSREVFGKQTLLVFSEDDDYFTYISHFYPDGTHTLSSGVFISAGYGHVAMPFRFAFSAKAVLTHELVHSSLFHLPLPTWLNEGLAQRIERQVGDHGFRVDGELAQRHRTFWNPGNIQRFWAGYSFGEPGDPSELSYSLGEILVELLNMDGTVPAAFLDFVSQADWRDGGQDAAARILEKDLGAVVEGFLGPGEWRPNRKKLSDLFQSPTDSVASEADHSNGESAI